MSRASGATLRGAAGGRIRGGGARSPPLCPRPLRRPAPHPSGGAAAAAPAGGAPRLGPRAARPPPPVRPNPPLGLSPHPPTKPPPLGLAPACHPEPVFSRRVPPLPTATARPDVPHTP